MLVLKRRKVIKQIYNVLCLCNYQGTIIKEITLDNELLLITLVLPPNKESIHLEQLLTNIKEEMTATDIKIKHTKGKTIHITLSYYDLDNIEFNDSYFMENTLKIPIQTPFGTTYIDFYDSASCHMLSGGSTRMGKTNFLLFLITILYIQNKGNIKFYIATAKPKDFYCYQRKKNITITKEHDDLKQVLKEIEEEYNKRLSLLDTEELFYCIDAKDVIKKKSKYKHLFNPIFVVIDEYARYSDNKEIQKEVTKLVETSGYLNIHVIISTQRSDARTVLNPRIRANLLCSLAFSTKDKDNSKLIIGLEGAEKLGKIPGRGLLANKDLELIQIPYMDYEQINLLMNDYKEEHHENKHKKDSKDKRFGNNELVRKMESLFNNPNSNDII